MAIQWSRDYTGNTSRENKRLCINCGKKILEDSKFCEFCGTKLSSPEFKMHKRKLGDEYILCPFCKKEILKDDPECPYCHRTIKEKIIQEEKRHSLGIEKRQKEGISQEESSFKYAGLKIRLGAFLVDNALIIVIAFILGFLNSNFIGLTWPRESDTIIGFIFIVFYHTLFLSILSSTPGKILYGLKIVHEKTGENITFGRALGRSLSYFLSSMFFGLGFLNIAFDKTKHQGWHDKIAKTLVIKQTKKSLILPTILSIIALIFSLWAILSQEGIYDFGYLGKEATTINSIRERISQQPLDYCCSQLSSKEISNLLKEIPAKSPSKGIKTSEQIFEEFSKAIVVVGGENSYGEFGFGSGFIISPSGLFVTNYHVIEDMGNLAVALTGEELRILDVKSIIAKDAIKDIAVLKAEGQKLPYVFMGNSDLAKVGQRVFALGSPEGYTNTISDGIVSQIREFKAGIKSIQITTPTSQGSSGGALFNDKGEVIGITDSGDWYGQNINFAIPVNYVKELLGIK